MKAKIGIALVGVLAVALVIGLAWAQSVPQLINYQGRLTNGGGQPLADGSTVDLTFAFYGVASGGTPYLTVLQKDVVVTGGLYNVLIGSGTVTPETESTLAAVFQKHADVWMGVKVDTDNEMTPRARVSSVPYALSANMSQVDQFMRNPDYDGDGYDKDYIYSGDDCDDGNPLINPGATEVCDDGIDNDCDGDIDGSDADCCTDGDLDLFYSQAGCGTEVDCDDLDPFVYPGALELCDAVDNQCPGDPGYGQIDEGCGFPNMALIPAGCFNMGDSSDGCMYSSSECPVHNVCITSGFHMDVHEVTNAEYAACVSGGGCTAPAYSDSYTRNPYYGNPAYDDFPVIYVTWNQATAYCSWAGKRLPAEAEWEYAARGGLSGKRYPWGDSISWTDANYYLSGGPWDDTSPVEYYAANGYGLYDMAGNVSEWVNDWYLSTYYSTSPTNDPPGPPSGTYRVMRGGDWAAVADYLRVATRDDYTPTVRAYYLGFRCAGD
jgi:formylglycine-generating enzyme required for sulfatase activity